mmetsp:Transcript_63450/g.141326  ORF Transcript_63450/g.141326 Transcript_63450/m.141326 type:complete len:245 (+) Transcript_63450:923-1657(+)
MVTLQVSLRTQVLRYSLRLKLFQLLEAGNRIFTGFDRSPGVTLCQVDGGQELLCLGRLFLFLKFIVQVGHAFGTIQSLVVVSLGHVHLGGGIQRLGLGFAIPQLPGQGSRLLGGTEGGCRITSKQLGLHSHIGDDTFFLPVPQLLVGCLCTIQRLYSFRWSFDVKTNTGYGFESCGFRTRFAEPPGAIVGLFCSSQSLAWFRIRKARSHQCRQSSSFLWHEAIETAILKRFLASFNCIERVAKL